MKILGRISSMNVRKVLWSADEIGLAYSREDWGMGFASTRSPEFLSLNPNGLVPVLQDDRGTMWESNAICRYLAGRHGRTDLLPEEPWARAEVERWMDWAATDLNAAWRYAFPALVRGDPPEPDPARLAESVGAWNAAMSLLEGQLAATGAHVAGKAFTLADVCIGLAVNRWLSTPIERPELPAVLAYFDRLRSRPAFTPYGPGIA